MAQKKAHEVDGWLARPDSRIGTVLIYGPDRGLVSERARLFATATGLPLDDPFSVIRLEGSTVENDPGRLLDEARTVPMFGGRRLIWISEASAQKSFVDGVAALLAEPVPDTSILIEAADLKKSAPLRTLVEQAGDAMALPCYPDEGRSIDALIDDELSRAGLSITLDARQALKASLGGDRLASRSEIGKLILYCAGQQRIEVEDVRLATGDVSSQSADTALDAVLAGRTAAFDTAFAQFVAAGSPPFLILSAAMRQFQNLQAMRAAMEREGKPASAVVVSARPPVFFSRRSLVQTALERSSSQSLARALDRINTTVLETRRRPALAEALTRQAMLALALEMARAGR